MTEKLTLKRQINESDKFATLKLWVQGNDEFKDFYREKIEKHNHHVLTDPHPNSGFDLYVPEEQLLLAGGVSFINFLVKAQMRFIDKNMCAYYLYPRSSLSKTPLMLANSVGIMDEGYTGSLLGAFRHFGFEEYKVEKYQRLVQICHPSLCPIFVSLMEDTDSMVSTIRGGGGFGSTL